MSDAIEIQTGANPDASVLWLHGLGADGHDFESVVPEIVHTGERSWRFVFPHAPVRPITINAGARMRAWYDIRGIERGAVEDEKGYQSTFSLVRDLIQSEAKRGIEANRVVVAGFSQGGVVCLYLMSRYPEKLAGVMALSCYLPMAKTLSAERLNANDSTPVFMAHGAADPMIPVERGRQARDQLARLGYPVEWHEYPMPHSVCAAEIADIRAFLFKTLG